MILGIILVCSGIEHLFKDLKEWEQRLIIQADAEKVQVYNEIKAKGDTYKVQVNVKKNGSVQKSVGSQKISRSI